MNPELIFITFLIYTIVIFSISWITSRKADNQSFFIGNHKSPWIVVAYGMVGASLSGVTFISVPGWVSETGWNYFIIVLGYVVGYVIITTILLPIYYRQNLTSIYTYLNNRFGNPAYKTGSVYFLISRVIGASFRMFLVVSVLQVFVFDHFGIPFWVTVVFFMILIQLYTIKGGIKTIIWTDTLQTTFMLASVITTIVIITMHMDVSFGNLITEVWNSEYSRILELDIDSKQNFIKLFLSGVFITIVMTGLDQDMMQKNLSCKNIGDAQKNMTTLSLILIPVNLIFLFLGAIILIYSDQNGIPLTEYTDHIFANLAFNYLGPVAGIIFIIGLISAAYSSADSALTSLTTSFTIDILELDKKYKDDGKLLKKKRYLVHAMMSTIIIFVMLIFKAVNNQAVIAQLFTLAGYTYGPLLGLYAFGLFTKINLKNRYIPIVAVIAPILSYIISSYSTVIFKGYQIGFELLIINGLLTFFGLYLIRKKNTNKIVENGKL